MLRLPDATLMVRLSGEWKLGRQLPQGEEFRRRLVTLSALDWRESVPIRSICGGDKFDSCLALS